MSEYIKTSNYGIDSGRIGRIPVKNLHEKLGTLETTLRELDGGQCIAKLYGDNRRMFLLKDRKCDKLFTLGPNFEKGFSNLLSVATGETPGFSTGESGQTKASSPIDEWLCADDNIGQIIIKSEQRRFTVGATNPFVDDYCFIEVNGESILYVFNEFYRQIAHLNAIAANPLVKKIYGSINYEIFQEKTIRLNLNAAGKINGTQLINGER